MMSDWIQIPCFIKINVFLHIVGQFPQNHKKTPSYHELQSIFALLKPRELIHNFDNFDTFDTLHAKMNHQGVVQSIQELLPHDLCLKTVNVLKKWCFNHEIDCKNKGVEWNLIKKIPMGSGLGAGSGNAAALLFYLNTAWHLSLSQQQLNEIALLIGADVPVFLYAYFAKPKLSQQLYWVEGIGEKVTPLQYNDNDDNYQFIAIYTPPINIPTSLIFENPQLKRNTEKINVPEDNMLYEKIWDSRIFHNDCEIIALLVNSTLQKYQNLMQKSVLNTYNNDRKSLNYLKMTGSGSSFFMPFIDEKKAMQFIAETNELCIKHGLQKGWSYIAQIL